MTATQQSQGTGSIPSTSQAFGETAAGRVLLIVSDPMIHLNLASRLRLSGFEVTVTSGGEMARQKFHSFDPHAVVLDLTVDDGKGDEVIRDLRRTPDGGELPIYAFSSSPSAKSIRRADKSGVTRLFTDTNTPFEDIIAELSKELPNRVGNLFSNKAFTSEPASGEETEASLVLLRGALARLGSHLEIIHSASDNDERAAAYGEMRDKMQAVLASARESTRPGLYRLAAALHSLLKVLGEMPECATQSTCRSVATAIEVLGLIAAADPSDLDQGKLDLYAVIGDDDMVSRSIVCSALRSVGFRFESFSHTALVVPYLSNAQVDLVVLHPGTAESEDSRIGKVLRAKTKGVRAPVVVVSGVSDFENHSNLVVEGIDEVITKPFIFMELSVKALSLALKKRLAARQAEKAAALKAAEYTPSGEGAQQDDSGDAIAFGDEGVQMGAAADDYSAAVPAEIAPPKLPSSRFKGSSISAAVGSEGATTMVTLREELEKKRAEREKLVTRIFNTEMELDQIRTSLDEEREHRQQLEQMVQDLMVGQAPAKLDLEGKATQDVTAESGAIDMPVPQEVLASLESRLEELNAEAETLRSSLEARQQEREKLATRIYQDELEIEAIRAQLEEERAQRLELESKLETGGDSQVADAVTSGVVDESKVTMSDELVTLQRTQDELLKQLAAAQAENEAEFKGRAELEVRMQELTRELEQARNTQQILAAERKQLETEFEAKLAEAKQALSEEQAAQQSREQEGARLENELTGARQRQTALEESLDKAKADMTEMARSKAALDGQLANLQHQLEKMQGEHARVVGEQTAKIDDLQKQLGQMQGSVQTAETARDEEVQHRNQLQKELDDLWQAQEELDAQLSAEKYASTEGESRRRDLESRLQVVSAELAKAQEAVREATGKAQSESGRRDELESKVRELQNELDSKLNSQSLLEVEMYEQKAELENRLNKLEQELPLARERIAELSRENEQVQQELAGQLKAATQATAAAEEKARQELSRSQQLEAELARNREENQKVSARLQTEQQRVEEAVAARAALEQRLAAAAAEIEESLTTRRNLLEQHRQTEATLNERVEEARKELAASRQQALETRSRIEANLKQQTDELNSARVEHKKTLDAKNKRESELTRSLETTTQELASTRNDLEKAGQRASEFSARLNELREAHTALESRLAEEHKALAEARQRSERLETRQSQTQVICDELKAKLAAEQEASVALSRQKSELEQRFEKESRHWADAKREFEGQVADYKQREASLEKELNTLGATATQAEVAHQKELDRANKFEAEVTQLWQVRDDLKARVASGQKIVSDLNQQRAALERQLAETVEQLGQTRDDLETARNANAKLETDKQSLAEEVTTLKSEAAVAAEKQRGHESELASMDRRVRDTIASLARTTGELESERGERRRVEQRAAGLTAQLQDLHRELNSHLEVEKENRARLADLEKEIAERVTELNAERAALETERGERRNGEKRAAELAGQIENLRTELAERVQLEQENQSRISNLEQQLRAREESLVRVTQHLENEREERRRVEQRAEKLIKQTQQLQDQLIQAGQREKEQQNQIAKLEEQGSDRAKEIEHLQTGLAGERSERGKFEERAQALAVQLRDLHNELNEHLRLEKEAQSKISQLEGQLGESQQMALELRSHLEKETADRELAEEQLAAAGDISAKLKQYQNSFDEARRAFEATQRELETRLETAAQTLAERETTLAQETEAKAQLQKALDMAQRDVQSRTQQHSIELSKLQSTLQVESMERRRLESDAMHSRYASLQSSRSGRTLVNGFRRQLEKPVDQLMQQARRMLSFELNGNLKEVAEELLKSAVTLQNNVRECDVVDVAAAEARAALDSSEADTELIRADE